MLIGEWMETKHGASFLRNFNSLRLKKKKTTLKFSVDFSSNFRQKNRVETLEICLTDSLSMKGIHTWGRRSTPCVTSGEWRDIWKLWWNLLVNLCLTHADRYTLKGPNYMVCKKSGWTGEFPTCEGEDQPWIGEPSWRGLTHLISSFSNIVAQFWNVMNTEMS